MNVDLLYRPVSTLARVRLQSGEQVLAEPGSMVGMTPNLKMESGIGKSGAGSGGGLLGKLAGAASRMLTGESFFQNTYTAQGDGELLLAHTLPGDMELIEVPRHGLKMQSTSFIASTMGVNMAAEFGGTRTFFGGEGMFVISVTTSGEGEQLLVGAFGGIQEMQVDGSLVIDTGHLVAWDANLNFNITSVSSGWIGSFLSGEGLVCSFQGQGRVWIQTRQPNEYGTLVGRMLPPRTN